MAVSPWKTRRALAFFALLCAPLQSWQSGTAPSAGTQAALPAKETLSYLVEWRLINAGLAKLSLDTNPQPSRPGYQVQLHLESTGLVSRLFKVDDDYSAMLNRELCAVTTHLTAKEGSRQRETQVAFDGAARKASYLERDLETHKTVLSKETDIPACVHDVIGGLYHLRTLHLEPGQSAQVQVSDGKKSVAVKVEAQGREEIKTGTGTYKTIRYEVFIFNNVLYRRPAHLHVWLSDDRRRLPVRLQVRLQFTIGTITFQLQKEERT
jgi:hypothetical protein